MSTTMRDAQDADFGRKHFTRRTDQIPIDDVRLPEQDISLVDTIGMAYGPCLAGRQPYALNYL